MATNSDVISFLLTLLLGGTMVLGIFIVVLLLKSEMGLAKWLLATTLLALQIHLLTFLLFITQLIQQWPHLLGVGYPFIFLTGPAFYFFVKTYAEPKFTFSFRYLVHLIPALLLLFFMIPTYVASVSEKLKTIEYYYTMAPTEGLTWFEWAYLNLHVVLILGYVAVSLKYIYQKEPYNAGLLKKFCWLFFGLSVLYLVLQSGFLITGISLITSEIVLSALMAVVVLLLGFWVLDIRQIFPDVADSAGKYQTSPLSD